MTQQPYACNACIEAVTTADIRGNALPFFGRRSPFEIAPAASSSCATAAETCCTAVSLTLAAWCPRVVFLLQCPQLLLVVVPMHPKPLPQLRPQVANHSCATQRQLQQWPGSWRVLPRWPSWRVGTAARVASELRHECHWPL